MDPLIEPVLNLKESTILNRRERSLLNKDLQPADRVAASAPNSLLNGADKRLPVILLSQRLGPFREAAAVALEERFVIEDWHNFGPDYGGAEGSYRSVR